MSYILDALKKLEKERKRGIIPGLSEQDSIVYHSQKKSVWPYILIPLLLVVAGVLVVPFLMKPSNNSIKDTATTDRKTVTQSVPEEIKPLPSAMKPVQSPAPQTVPVRKTDESVTKTNNEKKAESPASQEKNEPAKTAVLPAETSPRETPQVSKEIKPPQSAPKSEVRSEPAPKKKLYRFSELPPSVRDSLTKFFTVTAYMYSSTPSERKVRINDRMMREGQVIEPGIRIEEIVPDGVILTYNNFRFFVTTQ